MKKSSELKEWREQNLIHKLIYDWIIVPFGILAIIAIVIGINQLFRVSFV